jgi:hypothetical protein
VAEDTVPVAVAVVVAVAAGIAAVVRIALAAPLVLAELEPSLLFVVAPRQEQLVVAAFAYYF